MYRRSSSENRPTSARNKAGETLCYHVFQLFFDRHAADLTAPNFQDAVTPIETCGPLDTVPLVFELDRSLIDAVRVQKLAVNLLFCVENSAQRSTLSPDLLLWVGNLIVGWRESELRTNHASEVDALLSPREHTVLECIGQGRTNKEIARELGIAPETVKSHIKNIFVKLAVEKRAQAICYAQRLGLVERHRPRAPPSHNRNLPRKAGRRIEEPVCYGACT
jgi:DNA-binding CsgD family transcriptional regulator